MDIRILLASHIIFMVTFFAGTFYIIRLFIYHKEALAKFEPDRSILSRQFALMERRLWYYITWPSFVLLIASGTWILVLDPRLMQEPWMHAKLGLVALMVVYHLINQKLFTRIQRNELGWKSHLLRLWNQGATLILLGVVLLVSMKDVQWYYGVIGLVVVGIVLVVVFNMYRKKRTDEEVEPGRPRP